MPNYVSPEARLRQRLRFHLERIYKDSDPQSLIEEIMLRVHKLRPDVGLPQRHLWSESDAVLITYGDSLKRDGEMPLQTLNTFLNKYLKGVFSGVHVLPFYPYSSDDGFSVIDYEAVNPSLGDWSHIREIGSNFKLMSDLVINHVSAQSQWFQDYLADKAPYNEFFIEMDPDTDVSKVVRPRAHPVLTPVETVKGTKYVWATFSPDQVDVNFENPKVLLTFIEIVLFYLEQGVRWLRLDAVGFLWKEIGTSCIHLPETHEAIRLIRCVAEAVCPDVVIITETNVPNVENLSYFGNRNEAHAIYNFSLPPLLVNALLRGRSRHLREWLMSMPPCLPGCTYFNFVASHDGIGLRPAEGLLNQSDINGMVRALRSFGAEISMRTGPDGSEKPYEVNVSLFDALKGTLRNHRDGMQVERFLCAQRILMTLEGIPGVYIHSLLATPNDRQGYAVSGVKRHINRHKWNLDVLEKHLADPNSPQSRVFHEMIRVLKIRGSQPAFHPNAVQFTLHFRPALFGYWRQSLDREQNIFVINNITDKPQTLQLSSLNLTSIYEWYDLLTDKPIDDLAATIDLEPYESIWITNRIEHPDEEAFFLGGVMHG
jgi:sucrose phosphorylase